MRKRYRDILYKFTVASALALLFSAVCAAQVLAGYPAVDGVSGAEEKEAARTSSQKLSADDQARLTDEERFGIDGAWIETADDGAVTACWNPSPGCSEYYVTVFRNNRTVISHVFVRGEPILDITEAVAEKGEGTYRFSVFSVRGGPKMKEYSESADLSEDDENAAAEIVALREDARIRANGGLIEKLKVNATERKVKDSPVRALEFKDGKYYRVTAVEFSIDPEVWLPGNRVEVTVTVAPKDGFRFAPEMELTGSKNLEDFRSYAGETSAGEISETDVRSIRASYVVNAQLDKPRVLFVTEDGILFWEASEYASGYTVTISRMGSAEKTFRLTRNYVDISDYMEKLSLTDVTVLARGDGVYFRNSEKCTITDLEKFLGEAQLSGAISENDGNYYFTFDDGSVAEGWVELRNNWFYFGKNGKMYRNRTITEADGSVYRLNRYGRMLQSELFLDETGLRYFGADGRMAKDTVTPEGYVVDADGYVVVAQKYIDALENW